MGKMKGVMFFRRKFLVSKYQKKFRGTLLCLEKFVVMKLFMHRMGHHGFVDSFLSQETNNFLRGDPRLSELFWYGRKIRIKTGVSRFSFGNFLSHSAEKIRRGRFFVSKNSGIEIFLA